MRLLFRGARCGLLGIMVAAGCRTMPLDPPPVDDVWAAARVRLVAELRTEGITDERVLAAVQQVPRHEFVRTTERDIAYADQALPIGGGQTISQPYIVALMTQLLELHGTERVLEIGTGSGYQAAVLALLARQVYSVEIDAALADAAQRRLRSLGYDNVHVRAGDGFFGWAEAAPFDAVIVTAVAPTIPPRLVAQLRDGGRLVIPLGGGDRQVLERVRKFGDRLQQERITDVLFVPMTGAVRRPPQP